MFYLQKQNMYSLYTKQETLYMYTGTMYLQ
jgi:hypothetical protein